MEIHVAVKELLEIVEALHKRYPKKKFTLDGRLVGDLGEVLVAAEYDIILYEGLAKHHDGETSDGRLVQIKTTMKDSLTFPVDHIPDYYLGIKVHPDGSFSEIFNGPGLAACEAIKNRAPTKTNLHSIPISKLEKMNRNINISDRVPKRIK
jgi:hypothetical protein